MKLDNKNQRTVADVTAQFLGALDPLPGFNAQHPQHTTGL